MNWNSDTALSRHDQRRRALVPWVDEKTQLVDADRWLDFSGGDIRFELGGAHFRLIDVSGVRSPEDIMLFVENDRVLPAGDLHFSGCIPFVDQAHRRAWLAAGDKIASLALAMLIPGHGASSRDRAPAVALRREYLQFLRDKRGAEVRELKPFDEAYAEVDWSRCAKARAFDAAGRIHARGNLPADGAGAAQAVGAVSGRAQDVRDGR